VHAVGAASSKLASTGYTDRSRGSRANHADGGDGNEYDLGEGVHVEVGSSLVGWGSPLVAMGGGMGL
jgi:hypothetical protein